MATEEAELAEQFLADDEDDSGDWFDCAGDELYRRDLSQLIRILRSQAVGNAEYFKGAAGSANERLHASFGQLWNHLDGVETAVELLLKAAPMFDFSPSQPGNGYRSMVTVVHRCLLRIMTLSRYIGVNRESYLFRAERYGRELEAYVTLLGQLRACLFYLQKLVPYCTDGSLFPDEDTLPTDDYETAERLLKEVESLSQEAFYGRCLGFQFCASMVRPLTTINLVMASYGDGYGWSSRILKVATSVLGSQKYYRNPELRARQVVNLTRSIDIGFCKGFWALTENVFMHKVPLYICPSVAVDKVIVIGPESFSLPLVGSHGCGSVKIEPPSAHTGVGPVNTRLISARYRSGQEVWYRLTGYKAPSEPSPNLIIHCHGGGFVAQSSATHQVYLRHWASDLDAPILSVDYSLAPENRFPRQFEEVFYAYCWAIKNCRLLGSTAERVCIVGDSAGANLAVSVALKLAEMGLRQPDGIVSIYGCLLIKYLPSASRILSLMDPLLPLGVLSLCLHAYAAESDQENVGNRLHVVNNNALTTENGGDVSDDSGCRDAFIYSSSDDELSSSATEPEDDNNIDSDDQSIVTTSEIRLNSLSYSGRTDTSMYKTQQRREAIAEARNAKFKSPVCPSGEVIRINRASPKQHRGLQQQASAPLYEQSLVKSCSAPTFRPMPACLRGAMRTKGIVLDNELFHVSTYAELHHFDTSPHEMFKNSHISKSPYMSPYLAPDDLLRRLSPVHLVACHLDPMLDDSVMFARRLRDIGNPVRIDFVSDLPHGFLNFVLVSREAKAASDRCVDALRRFLSV
jgi:hormone-sensitive lipase